mmetsp:Transcript_47272/g.143138  ORF Transcript_47272/g.143138 Transcript_47272/m.143138 type:complete len:385 (-) Transcript_47272:260-1414(-)
MTALVLASSIPSGSSARSPPLASNSLRPAFIPSSTRAAQCLLLSSSPSCFIAVRTYSNASDERGSGHLSGWRRRLRALYRRERTASGEVCGTSRTWNGLRFRNSWFGARRRSSWATEDPKSDSWIWILFSAEAAPPDNEVEPSPLEPSGFFSPQPPFSSSPWGSAVTGSFFFAVALSTSAKKSSSKSSPSPPPPPPPPASASFLFLSSSSSAFFFFSSCSAFLFLASSISLLSASLLLCSAFFTSSSPLPAALFPGSALSASRYASLASFSRPRLRTAAPSLVRALAANSAGACSTHPLASASARLFSPLDRYAADRFESRTWWVGSSARAEVYSRIAAAKSRDRKAESPSDLWASRRISHSSLSSTAVDDSSPSPFPCRSLMA